MNVKNLINHIGNLVGSDRLGESIELLSKIFAESPILNDVILQSAKLTDIENQIRRGVISFENANVSKNKIRLAILNLAELIDEIAFSNPSVVKEIEQNKSLDNAIQQFHYGNGDNIAGNKITTNYYE
jgi:hypothetical protein